MSKTVSIILLNCLMLAGFIIKFNLHPCHVFPNDINFPEITSCYCYTGSDYIIITLGLHYILIIKNNMT